MNRILSNILLAVAPLWLSSSAFAEPLQLKPKTGLKPFTYTNSPDALPNYVAGAKWGTQTDPIRTMQVPLSPEESAQHLVLPPGFEAKLWAADPEIKKPICMAWDERGRLWIAETIDYPNELQPEGQGRDRIKICEDTNGDGRADKFTVFAEQLSIPTGMVFANGGLIVVESGHTLFLKDTNGDDKADERRVLFKGWGMGDTHATASNLRYGLDNWIWGTAGYSGFDGTVGGKRVRFGMGVYRFKPDGSVLEFIKSSNNNTWGLGLSEEGIVFGSTANNNVSWYMPVPNRFYEAVNGWSAGRMETIADSQAFYPSTEKVRQVDWHHKYTAGAGHALYTARSYPKEFWNRIAFVTEPTGHLIGWFDLQAVGADFKARNLGSFLASDDEWTAPIMAEVGPDGAVWMIDWYNYIVQHNPVPVGFKNGKGNAYETNLRDKRHGRIYRLNYTAGKASAQSKLAKASGSDLVAALKNDNQLWRMHSQRLLVERGKKDVVSALLKLVRDTSVDEIGLNPGAIHALWTLHGLGAAGDSAPLKAITTALKHPSAGVRRAAAGVLPRDDASGKALRMSLTDPDAQVRLAAYLALAESPASVADGEVLFAVLAAKQISEDRWQADAIASAGVRHQTGFLNAALASDAAVSESAADVVRIVARDYASRAPKDVTTRIASLSKAAPASGAAFLEGLAMGWPSEQAPKFSDGERSSLEAQMGKLPASLKSRLLLVGKRWAIPGLFEKEFASITSELKTAVGNADLEDKARIDAAKSWVRLADEAGTAKGVLDHITLQTSPPLAVGLIAALGESRADETGREVLGRWSKFTPAQRKAGLAMLLRRSEWARALLDAVEAKELQVGDLGPEHWQQLRNSQNRSVAARAREISDAAKPISADREEVVKKFLPAAKTPGDVGRGKEVFAASCAVCHKLNGQGSLIGPELTGVGARPMEDVLVDILDPNRSVESNYRLWNVTTKDGETLSGRLDAETQTSIELLDLTGQKHTFQRKEIASLEASTLSIMPTGLEAIGDKDLASLLAYLATSTAPAKH
jgi:putative membrane-bound dehydrogenase-like protein